MLNLRIRYQIVCLCYTLIVYMTGWQARNSFNWFKFNTFFVLKRRAFRLF